MKAVAMKFAAFVAARKKWLATLGAGWTIERLFNWAFEYGLYPVVIGYYGLLKGGGIMVFLSVIFSLLEIRIYDKARMDWLGIETLKSLRDDEKSGKIVSAIRKALLKCDLIALVILSVISEPVKVTLYLRKGANQYNGFAKRDWIIFLTCCVISNSAWALVVFGGVEFFKKVLF